MQEQKKDKKEAKNTTGVTPVFPVEFLKQIFEEKKFKIARDISFGF